MELSRRDAVAALAAIGIGGGAVYAAGEFDDDGPADESPDDTSTDQARDDQSAALVETTIALADVVYPSDVTDSAEFVRTFVTGRIEDDEDHRAAMAEAVDALDDRAREQYDEPFRDLSAEEGDALLQDLGMRRIDPDPDGSERERIRYYLVNELLYGLMSSPKGGALAGIENPPGHPGGLEAYQQGPQQ